MSNFDFDAPRYASREVLIAHIRSVEMGDTPAQMRHGFARIMAGQPDGTSGEIGAISGLYVGDGPLLGIWLHGGGYVFGAPKTHTLVATIMARHLKGRVFLPHYRLAPEHVWPAPLDDVQKILASLDAPITLFGDSAGGHLAIQAARSGHPNISKLVLFSPNTDRTGQSATYHTKNDADVMNDPETDDRLFRMSAPNLVREHPAASPILAKLDCLPPTLLHVGGDEILLDDSLRLSRAAALQGCDITLKVYPKQFHMFWQWPDVLHAACEALEMSAVFACKNQ